MEATGEFSRPTAATGCEPGRFALRPFPTDRCRSAPFVAYASDSKKSNSNRCANAIFENIYCASVIFQ
jgi:hypothetical protein